LARPARVLAAAAALALLAGCGGGGNHTFAEPPATSNSPPQPDRAGKVLVIFEENQTYDEILGSGKDTPYLKELAAKYGAATHLQAGYPAQCPSLAGYLILTSGTDHAICDDKLPKDHPLPGPTVFSQVKDSGREWRVYAESMPTNCAPENSGSYAVRHTAAPYYTDIAADCRSWDIPMGPLTSGALHNDIRAGRLPAFSLAIPDVCHDMHGGKGCKGKLVPVADDWLRELVPQLTSGPDWKSGRLTVVITWDEGTTTDNHIPALVLTPHALGVRADHEASQCSLLRLISDVVKVAPLGCAAVAPSLTAAFGLKPQK
jgi:phospholipase C